MLKIITFYCHKVDCYKFSVQVFLGDAVGSFAISNLLMGYKNNYIFMVYCIGYFYTVLNSNAS